MLDRILALEPDTHFARRERGVNLVSIGDRWLLVGDTQRSLTPFRKASASPANWPRPIRTFPTICRDVAMAWDRLGDVRVNDGPVARRHCRPTTSPWTSRATWPSDRPPTATLAAMSGWRSTSSAGSDLQLGRTEQAAKHYDDALAIAWHWPRRTRRTRWRGATWGCATSGSATCTCCRDGTRRLWQPMRKPWSWPRQRCCWQSPTTCEIAPRLVDRL